jgi:hypothetical protein
MWTPNDSKAEFTVIRDEALSREPHLYQQRADATIPYPYLRIKARRDRLAAWTT